MSGYSICGSKRGLLGGNWIGDQNSTAWSGHQQKHAIFGCSNQKSGILSCLLIQTAIEAIGACVLFAACRFTAHQFVMLLCSPLAV